MDRGRGSRTRHAVDGTRPGTRRSGDDHVHVGDNRSFQGRRHPTQPALPGGGPPGGSRRNGIVGCRSRMDAAIPHRRPASHDDDRGGRGGGCRARPPFLGVAILDRGAPVLGDRHLGTASHCADPLGATHHGGGGCGHRASSPRNLRPNDARTPSPGRETARHPHHRHLRDDRGRAAHRAGSGSAATGRVLWGGRARLRDPDRGRRTACPCRRERAARSLPARSATT